MPASIAILTDAAKRDGAERFVDFVLSPDGQSLLLNPAVARLPISPATYPAGGTTDGNPYQRNGLFAKGLFDAGLSAARYELVNIIFDEMITFRRSELGRMWRSVRTIEAALAERSDTDLAKLVSDARGALTRPPLSGAEAMELMQSPAGRGPGAALGVIAVLLVALCTFASHLIIEKSQKAKAAG